MQKGTTFCILILHFTICISLLSGTRGYSQYYSTGQDPASVSWSQIKTDRYRLIFPKPFEKKAQYLANIMDIICRNETTTLSARVPRIPVILHTQTVVSNGLTVWAPKRIELYTCPPQQTYAEEWLEQLAIHEYRHGIQISKINNGFSKVLYYIFGEQITGGILGLYVPAWFLEGDATAAETAMTRSGRGRSGLFECTLRAQLVEKGPFSYDKATMGSYRAFTPDAYSLGYYLVGQSRKKYSPEIWNTALDRVARYPFMVVPFNSGIRKATGKWKTQLYKESLGELDSAWRGQLLTSNPRSMRYITKRDPKNHADYRHPLLLDDSTIFASKSCMDDVTRFVLIDRKTGREQIILTPGQVINEPTAIGGNRIAWSEMDYDPRWANRNYSRIMLYDFKTCSHIKLTGKTRYFAPVISPDGSGLVTVSISEENQCSIDVLAIPSGRLLKRFTIPGYRQAITPSWSSDATEILFTLVDERGQTMSMLDTASGKILALAPASYNEFNGPFRYSGKHVFFSADYSGSENIYALDPLTHEVYQVTSGCFATYSPVVSADKGLMICSDYTSDGLMVAETRIDTNGWLPLSQVKDHSIRLYDAVASQERANIQDSVLLRRIWKMNASDGFNLATDTISGKIYEVKKYSKFLTLFNPHSWAPASFDISNLDLKPGVMVLSQNVLNSMFASAGWEYDYNEQTGKFYAGLSYRGWYPVFNFQFSSGYRAGYARYQGSNKTFRFTWQETKFSASVSIPWNLSSGRYSRSIVPSAGTSLTGIRHNSSTPEQFTTGLIQSMDYSLSATQYQHSNQKDLFPRLGQSFDAIYRNTPFAGNDMGSIFSVTANLYFPGFFRHHGIRVYGGYQQRNDNKESLYSFPDNIAYPRGYSSAHDEDLLSVRLNYKFPLCYPDFSFGSVIYLKRMKINLYYDWANGKNPGYINEYQSAGCELTADFHLLRFVAPIEMGVRSIYYPASGGWGFEFLYGISY